MAFSCFACFEAFEEGSSEKGGGDCRGQAPARPVSVIGKCGHLFHTDCLKKILLDQSGNVWVAKNCPICQKAVTPHDIIRVHASPYDNRPKQRPRVEELTMANKRLQEEYEALLKRFEMMRTQIGDMSVETEAIKRQKEELGLRLDQAGRMNSIHRADIDRYKAEIEKLKNIIITLSEKITMSECSSSDMYGSGPGNGINVGNSCRLEYTEELQRMSMCPPTASMTQNIIMNGSMPRPGHLHHPPGFLFPLSMPMENGGSEYQGSDRGSQTLSISPEIQKTIENAAGAVQIPGNGGLIHSADSHHRLGYFGSKDVQVRNFDANNNKNSEAARKEEEKLSNVALNENFSAAKYASVIGENNSKEKNEHSGSNGSNKVDKLDKEFNEADDAIEKWHEKKSRRRTSSRSSGGTASRRDRASGRYEYDKPLLYGSFSCPTCKAKWGSSQSVLNTPQTCRYCKTVVPPYNQGPILSRKQLEMVKQIPKNASSKVPAVVNMKI